MRNPSIMQPTTERLDEASTRELNPPAGEPGTRGDADWHGDEDHEHGVDRLELARIGFVAIAVAISWFHLWRPVAAFDAVAWAAVLVGGYPILKEALSALVARRMTMRVHAPT